MRASLTAFLLSAGVISAAANLHHTTRQSSGDCCFHLDSAGAVNDEVEEDHAGHLHLAGSFQEGVFCLNGTKVQDALGNQCFIRAPNYQFQCYQQGVIGNTTFDIVSADNGTTELVYDDGPGTYLACSSDGGESYEIYSTSKANTTDCLEVSLVLSDQTGECVVSTTDDACAAGIAARDVESPINASTCSVSASAPSLAPVKIGSPQTNATDGIHDTGANASVTATDSTIFHFSIPEDFGAQSSGICALEFRLPYCSDLPKGYPCFQFTGLEQEVLSNSGMVFSTVNAGDELASWNNTALQQVEPGDKKVLGTFDCGTADYGGGAHDVAWLANSLRNFGLQYEQAGVGTSEFKDGVGAFIVQCS